MRAKAVGSLDGTAGKCHGAAGAQRRSTVPLLHSELENTQRAASRVVSASWQDNGSVRFRPRHATGISRTAGTAHFVNGQTDSRAGSVSGGRRSLNSYSSSSQHTLGVTPRTWTSVSYTSMRATQTKKQHTRENNTAFTLSTTLPPRNIV